MSAIAVGEAAATNCGCANGRATKQILSERSRVHWKNTIHVVYGRRGSKRSVSHSCSHWWWHGTKSCTGWSGIDADYSPDQIESNV
jgi:hypothetical protein